MKNDIRASSILLLSFSLLMGFFQDVSAQQPQTDYWLCESIYEDKIYSNQEEYQIDMCCQHHDELCADLGGTKLLGINQGINYTCSSFGSYQQMWCTDDSSSGRSRYSIDRPNIICPSGQIYNPFKANDDGLFCAEPCEEEGHSFQSSDGECGPDLNPPQCGPTCGCGIVGNPIVTVGNPCDPATGNKYQTEVDYRSRMATMSIERYYNSLSKAEVGFGVGWTAGFSKRLQLDGEDIWILRETGREEPWNFNSLSNSYEGPTAYTKFSLEQSDTGYVLTDYDGAFETYDISGQLISETNREGQTTTYTYVDQSGVSMIEKIVGPFGQELSFSWNSDNRISEIISPSGGSYLYNYNQLGNLVQVTYPDLTIRIYHYEDANFPNNLTGITDENGGRYATFSYDADGRAVTTEHATTENGSPQERFIIEYNN